MIDRLQIRNFKSIAGAELEFGRVNTCSLAPTERASPIFWKRSASTPHVLAEESTPVF